MAAVLYLLGLISIVFGVAVAVDRFVDSFNMGLSLSVAYQALVGGVLLFVMARLLQHAAATARNTERFYQQMLQNPGQAAALGAAGADAAPTEAKPAEAKADAPKAEKPKAEAKPATEAEKPADKKDAKPAPAQEQAQKEAAAKKPAATAEAEKPAQQAAAKPQEQATAKSEPAAAVTKPEKPAAEAKPTIVEQIEYRGYMIDKLSNGKVDVHTAEGPMQFESLETFARELELSNG